MSGKILAVIRTPLVDSACPKDVFSYSSADPAPCRRFRQAPPIWLQRKPQHRKIRHPMTISRNVPPIQPRSNARTPDPAAERRFSATPRRFHPKAHSKPGIRRPSDDFRQRPANFAPKQRPKHNPALQRRFFAATPPVQPQRNALRLGSGTPLTILGNAPPIRPPDTPSNARFGRPPTILGNAPPIRPKMCPQTKGPAPHCRFSATSRR